MITTNINDKFYIGSAIDLDGRFGRHTRTLKRNCHPNPILQNMWNKHNDCKLNFYIIELCEKDKLIEREQHWIDALTPEINILKTAYSALGMTITKEARIKISNKLKNIPHSLERRKRQAEGQIGLKRPTLRKLSKWPHEKGIKCKCSECKQKKSEYLKSYWKTYERK
jgi:group I intron endonuclease